MNFFPTPENANLTVLPFYPVSGKWKRKKIKTATVPYTNKKFVFYRFIPYT